MIKEAIGTAESLEEAKEKAFEALNAPQDVDVQIEVISWGKKKTLGLFGKGKAQVRAYYEVADEMAPKAAKTEKPAKKAKAQTENVEAAPLPIEDKPETPAVSADEIPADSPAGKAVAYLKKILLPLGCENVAITVNEIEGGSQINLTGEGLGVVIGHRGETLDALQYLVSLAANAGVSGYHRIVLNTGDFRKKREQTLIALAKRMCDQAIKSGKCRTLEPMNPYERRIIHTTVQQIEGVTSTSFGEGTDRRVVIAPEGKEPCPRMDRNSRRGGRNSRYGSSRPRKEAYTPQPDPDKAPVMDAGETPLYGRIDK